MTAPGFLPPPKSFRGLTARELMSAENVENPGVPLGPAGPVVVPLPILDGGDVDVFYRLPSDDTDPGWPTPRYDSRGQTQVRCVAVVESAGAAGTEAFAEYSTTGASWATPGVADVTVPLDVVGPHPDPDDGWVDLTSAAIGDRLWRGRLRGGDDSASPALSKFHLQFRQKTAPPPPRQITPTFYDALFRSHLGTFADVDRTSAVSADNDPVAGWTNQVTGATVHGAQATSASRPLVSTTELLNGYRTLAFSGARNILFDGLFESATEATVFIVVRDVAEAPYQGLWNMGAGGAGTLYPDSDAVIKDIGGSTVRHDTVNPVPSLTNWHVYAFRSKAGEWANYLDLTQLYTTATNTPAFPSVPGIGVNWLLDTFTGYVAAFGMKRAWLTDEQIAAVIAAEMEFYNLV